MTDKQRLKPSEVAEMFGVHAKTIVRWAKSGKLPHSKTRGGHRRFDRADVETLLQRSQ